MEGDTGPGNDVLFLFPLGTERFCTDLRRLTS